MIPVSFLYREGKHSEACDVIYGVRYELGQALKWHEVVSVSDPTQVTPPWFLHVLDLERVPSPHETEQCPYGPNSVHPLLTEGS